MDIKWNKVTDDIRMQLKEEASAFLTSTEGDLGGWAAAIAADLAEAMAAGRFDLLPHISGQMRVLAGAKKVELSAAGWRTLDTVVSTTIKVVSSLLSAGVVA